MTNMPFGSDGPRRLKSGAGGARGFLALILLGLVPGCAPETQPGDETNSRVASEEPGPAVDPVALAELEALVEEWVRMWNSYDLNQVEALFLDDSRLTYFSSEKEGVIRGMEALLEHHRGFGFVPGGESRTSRLWLEGVEKDLLGDAAVMTGIWFFQSDGGSPDPPQKGPVTIVCVRVEGGWRFVHMNFSEYPGSEPL